MLAAVDPLSGEPVYSDSRSQLNAEIKRRTNVVGIFPKDASIVRLVEP